MYKRLHYHKQQSEKEPSRKVYKYFTYEKFVNGDIQIILVEEVSVDNKDQLRKIENEYIKMFCVWIHDLQFKIQLNNWLRKKYVIKNIVKTIKKKKKKMINYIEKIIKIKLNHTRLQFLIVFVVTHLQ